jgi:predicted transcriptional regulator
MLRTQISLSQEERETLDRIAAETGRSMSALIRDAVKQVYGPGHALDDDLASMRRAFGAWKRRQEGGAAYVERVRSGRRMSHVR